LIELETNSVRSVDRRRIAGEHALNALTRAGLVSHEMRPTTEWLADYGRQIDDLRVALDWAFSPRGNAWVGVALAVAAVPLWFQLSLVDECLGWVERALAALDMAPGPDERRRMQLYAALGWLQMYATARLESSTAAWRTALRLAEELGDTDYQLRALWALWADRTNHAEFREALTLASQFRSLSAHAGNVADQLVGDRMTGASLRPGRRRYRARARTHFGHGIAAICRERASLEAAHASARQLRACGRRGGTDGRVVVARQPGGARDRH
jgi:hypothetical protein